MLRINAAMQYLPSSTGTNLMENFHSTRCCEAQTFEE